MRTVVVAGASGLVGTSLVRQLLAHSGVGRVVAFVRRPLGVTDKKLSERDFAAMEMPKDVEDAYCALGTTRKQAGSAEAFIAVDKVAVLKFAQAARAAGARRFLLVSSIGANARSMNLYLRTKGEVEAELTSMGFDALHILQPSFLDGDRKVPRAGEGVGLAVARVLSPLLGKWAPVHVDVVAAAMVKLAFSDRFGVSVHTNLARV